MPQSRQLAVIMFTDIVGYTALMGQDEQEAFSLLQKNRDIQRPVIEEFRGRWLKELGDGVLVSFTTVTDAVNAAIRIQDICNRSNEFSLRIGIHHGEVIFEADDVFGDVVNIAARIQSIAPPGGIYISEAIHQNVVNKKDIRTRFIRQEYLKNVREPVNIYQVLLLEPETGMTLPAVEDRASASSILPDYQYDIFISFSDKDNKYDRWVDEFALRLKQELDATLKDKLTVHCIRGSSDPHSVKQSSEPVILEKGIHALIFVPVISQTYCDVNSRPWREEFKAFKSEIERDHLGPDIRLANGTVFSRILPVRIHDIDIHDVRMLEQELSGVLRSIDFIYRAEGVNRPLRPSDDEISLHNAPVLYRNQINKLANMIREIIQGIKAQDQGLHASKASVASPRTIPLENFVTSLPSSVQVRVVQHQKPNVFLAWTSADLKEQREEMAIILNKAGFNVLPSIDCPADDEIFKEKVQEEMARCSCLLLMLSGEYGRRFELEDDLSFPKYQFLEAGNRMQQDPEFNCFIWMHPQSSTVIKPAQMDFIKYIRNNITRNMMFSNSTGPMQLVDDMRIVMMKEESTVFDSKDTDIFFIFNQQDELEAEGITDRLSLEYPVEIMNIMPDSQDQYREISSQQIQKSKLAVVYFKYAADWALPFIKQIWKEVGGASSPTPLFLVGENDPPSNLVRSFKAPKVVSTIVPREEIPGEVKKVYTTVVNLK
jgi:class 3 adenylate cyclase